MLNSWSTFCNERCNLSEYVHNITLKVECKNAENLNQKKTLARTIQCQAPELGKHFSSSKCRTINHLPAFTNHLWSKRKTRIANRKTPMSPVQLSNRESIGKVAFPAAAVTVGDNSRFICVAVLFSLFLGEWRFVKLQAAFRRGGN